MPPKAVIGVISKVRRPEVVRPRKIKAPTSMHMPMMNTRFSPNIRIDGATSSDCTKAKAKLPDWNDPVGLAGSDSPTVEDFANRIHRSMMKQFKWALVWGASARHRPQRVGKEHVLQDEDVVQIVKK